MEEDRAKQCCGCNAGLTGIWLVRTFKKMPLQTNNAQKAISGWDWVGLEISGMLEER